MEQIILEIIKSKPKKASDLMKIKRVLAKKYHFAIIRNSDIYKEYRSLLATKKIKEDLNFENLLKKRAIRTMSGIAPVAVLTKPYACPGTCAYCPHEKDVPTSYLSNEPAVMRAIRHKYNPFEQVYSRLEALVANGHKPEKIELIVIGGSWSVLPKVYKYWFIKECFRAANAFAVGKLQLAIRKKEDKSLQVLKASLLKEQSRNEKAKYKIIGITLETRPDYIDEKELIEMREFGATRVELGVQAADDKILEINKRGHGVLEIAQATALLRAFGFKITYHLMPGLPGSNPAKDLEMFKMIFTDERFQPDQIKFYPTVVTRGSELYKWWKAGKYIPYTDQELEALIVDCKNAIPEYVRIIRLIRDIPGESIEAGNKITNLRQIMKQKGVVCRCIRCRECGEQKIRAKDLRLSKIIYAAAGGKEYFIQFESLDKKVLYGFCRLRIPVQEKIKNKEFSFLNKYALIRELHVYGELTTIGSKKKTQHGGLGKRLLVEAEKIAKQEGLKNIAVISGVGVRNYYRKNGYKLKKGYLVK
jgi:elongator complex protein 3